MTNNITIEQVNYFPELNYDIYNAKVLYRKYGKLRLCHIYIDWFNNQVHVPKQPKECNVLAGFQKAIYKYAEKTKWRFE